MSAKVEIKTDTSGLETIEIDNKKIKAKSIALNLSVFFDDLQIISHSYHGKIYKITLLRDNHWIHLDRYGYSRNENTEPYNNMINAIPGHLLPPMATAVAVFSGDDLLTGNEYAMNSFKDIVNYVINNPVEDAFESLLEGLINLRK